MKAEKELRKLLEAINESLKQDADCPGCEFCSALKVQQHQLKWILDGDSDMDRRIEEFVASVINRR